jgi:hypothetical protein
LYRNYFLTVLLTAELRVFRECGECGLYKSTREPKEFALVEFETKEQAAKAT